MFRNDEIDVAGIARCSPTRWCSRPGPARRPRRASASTAIRALRRQAADPRRLPRPPGDRRGARRQGRARRSGRCTARPSVIAHRRPRRLRRRCRSASRSIRYHSLAIERASAAGRARGHRDRERRRDHGRAPPRAGRHADAARRRAVPPRVDPHRARPRDAEELPGVPRHEPDVDLRSDTVTRPTAGDARRRWRARRARRRRLRRRPDASTRCRSGSPRCSARRRRSSCPAARRATWCALMSHCGAATSTSSARWRTPTAGKAAARRCSAASSRSRSPTQADGTLALADIEAAIKPDDAHFARTPPALPGEHHRRQGAAAGLPRAATALAQRGAAWRPTSTARACSMPPSRSACPPRATIARHFDSVSVCFSQGPGRAGRLGAGAARSDFIARAHRWRKMLGGGMRQAGVLAAAALHALDHHVDRLADDHAHRRAPGRRPAGPARPHASSRRRPTSSSPTSTASAAPALLEHLQSRGVLATGLYRLRFVTHLDVDAAGVDRAVAAMREHLALNRRKETPHADHRTPTR